jgi:CRISPR system Cascade subunit CasC
MLIEIHMIQNHSPANLNRDDLGAPKTCIFGGYTRARISSQCLKRSIRRSGEFAAALENGGGVRTRRLIELIAKEAAGEGNPPKKDHADAIRNVFKAGGVTLKDDSTFDILFFLPQSAVKEMGEAVRSGKGDLGSQFARIIGQFVKTPDIALCGRMTEFDAKGPFVPLQGQFTVEAALSAAHAISTHAVVNEVDYFTAADDVAGQDAGAAHVNEAMFNSACFYKHFVIDFEQLKSNLSNDAALAGKTVRCFLDAAAKANPSGKQHSFAAFNPPDGILVEVKTNPATPISYANAFADPVPDKAQRGLVGESIARLGQYAHDLADGYGISADRFWFSPGLRYPLTWVDESRKEHEKLQPVICSGGEFANFQMFTNAVMEKVANASTAEAK